MIETATFGGGCFWCTEAIFRMLRGVLSVESGYSGGSFANPGYRDVCSGDTGHAEVVRLTYDPSIVTYADLVRLHLLSHDPTTLNQQGADRGTQYRSVIFTHDDEQEKIAKQIIAEMQTEFQSAIVTEVKPADLFYKAEDSHQDYFVKNPDAGYCRMVIEPKVRRFREKLSK